MKEIKQRFSLDSSCLESVSKLERILAEEYTEQESHQVWIEQLSDDFSRFERNRDMVRFNLYKACMQHLQSGILRMFRLLKLSADGTEEGEVST